MAIDFLKILDTSRHIVGIIDMAKSIIWHSVYYGVGDFEIYCEVTPEHLSLLQVGYYVMRENVSDIGIIESVEVTFSLTNGYMIVASGRFAKSILDRRLIYYLNGSGGNTPVVISGKVEVATRKLVKDNAIDCVGAPIRNIPILKLGTLKNFAQIIVDENGNPAQKQVSCKNLLDYTDKLLKEYELASRITLNQNNKNLMFGIYSGSDRSIGNSSGNNPVIFSIEYDNLNSSDYLYDEKTLKNAAIIGGEGEGIDRVFTVYASTAAGLERREVFVDGSSINRQYKDENDQEQYYTPEEYNALLQQQGKNALAQQIVTEEFSGNVNVNFGNWKLNEDYYLGDTVTIQDNLLNIYINQKILETTEVQDENGYNISVVFGN